MTFLNRNLYNICNYNAINYSKNTLLSQIKPCHYMSSKPDTTDLGPPPSKPKRYFDLKRFRDYISKAKKAKIEAEKLFIARANALPPPEGWTISDFLIKMDIGENVEEIAASFNSWNEFITATPEVSQIFHIGIICT